MGDSFTLSALGILAVAGYWFVRLTVHCGLRGERRRNFLVAPVGGLVLVALLAAGAPLEARWHFSEDDFNRVVAGLPAPRAADSPVDSEEDGWERLPVPGKIGSYSITSAYRVPGGVIFYETNGSFFDDAGFGWFPDGPDAAALDNGSFERPEFSHLGGPWYTWNASW